MISKKILSLVRAMGCHEGYGKGGGFFFIVLWGFISDFFGEHLISFPEFCSQLWSMYVICSFPGVMCIGVSDPLDPVLEPSGSSRASCSHDLLHLPLWFAFYDVWGWFVVIRSMLFHLLIWSEKRCMEDIMDLPLLWNAQLIDHV